MNIFVDCTNKNLHAGGHIIRCAIGKNGWVQQSKGVEGDGKTPLGVYPIRYILYRKDRVQLPPCSLPVYALSPNDGWCDDPADTAYNRPVRLPYPARSETLFRTSHVYDIIVVLGHNDSPPIAGLGSAIFLHIARENYGPTEGCVAISLADMLKLIPRLGLTSEISIKSSNTAC